jgi:hypothetical protein
VILDFGLGILDWPLWIELSVGANINPQSKIRIPKRGAEEPNEARHRV